MAREGISPLPWRYTDWNGRVYDADGRTVAFDVLTGDGQLMVTACSNYDRVLAERDALLQALKAMASMYDGLDDAIGATVTAKVAAARAAIAKVEGT
jgi:hypothetical protein